MADIREVDALCTVHLRRVNVNLLRQDGVEMLSFEIPEGLAREAIRNTRTQAEAERYVMDRIHTIELLWPEWSDYDDDPGSTPKTKCGDPVRERSN